MKKLLVILGLMCLLLDLGQDGSIGKVEEALRWVQCSSVTALVQLHTKRNEAFPAKVTGTALQSTCLRDTDSWSDNERIAVEVPRPREIVCRCHFFSSGGIPS
jgi:hypothetical protein